jgi:hypothetical protein
MGAVKEKWLNNVSYNRKEPPIDYLEYEDEPIDPAPSMSDETMDEIDNEEEHRTLIEIEEAEHMADQQEDR